MRSSSIISVVYIVVGVVISSNHGYLGDFTTLPHIVSGILSVVLWPLLLIGVDLHVVF